MNGGSYELVGDCHRFLRSTRAIFMVFARPRGTPCRHAKLFTSATAIVTSICDRSSETSEKYGRAKPTRSRGLKPFAHDERKMDVQNYVGQAVPDSHGESLRTSSNVRHSLTY